jgi:hypothetical protein
LRTSSTSKMSFIAVRQVVLLAQDHRQ